MKIDKVLIITFACLFSAFFYVECQTYEGTPSLLFRIFAAFADATLLILPFLFVRKKFMIVLVALTPVIAFLLFCNLIYFRNFNDFIPPSSYFHASAFNPIVIEGVKNSIQLSDIVFLVSLVPFICYCFVNKEYNLSYFSNIHKRFTLLAIFISIFVIVGGSLRREYIYSQTKDFGEILKSVYPEHSISWKKYYNNSCFWGYMSTIIGKGLSSGHKITKEEKARIQKYLESRSSAHPSPTVDKEKIHNLIIIVVESLQSNVMVAEKNTGAISTLESLMHDSATFYIEKCRIQAEAGRSSDAQFIINTGLLPLRNEPFVNNYAHAEYPSLCKASGFNSIEIIGENKSVWSHAATNKAYGFSSLVSDIAENKLDQDSIIFERAFAEFRQLKSPRFAFISTLSMHDPYNKPKVSSSSKQEISRKERNEYIARLNHFDKSLKRFIDRLKASGDYDNTLIIIVGDHEIRQGQIDDYPPDKYVPLFIINSPQRSLRYENVMQLDIFPTIIDLLQLKYKFMGVNYKGLGTSLVSREYMSDKELETAYRVSELIIKDRP